MGKEGSTKTDAMRKQREEAWAAKQTKASTDKATSRPSGPSGADSVSTGSRSAPRTREAAQSKPRAEPAGGSPKSAAGSVDGIEIEPPDPTANNNTANIVKAIALRPREAAAGEGRCTGCGKLRAVKGGLIVSHRKGLNEMCIGSRKEPA